MKIKKIKEQVTEILDGLNLFLESHDCYLQLSDVKDSKVIIFCGGQGARCEKKCVEEAIKEKIPDFEVIFQ